MSTASSPSSPSASSSTHRSLFVRLQGDAPEAWDEFVARYSVLILRYAARHGLPQDQQEDLAQQTFLTLREHLPTWQYEPRKGGFRRYLWTVIRNAAWKMDRDRKRRRVVLDSDALEWLVNAEDPDQKYEEEWRDHHMRQALERVSGLVPPWYLDAFYETAVKGRDGQSVADAMGRTRDAVYKARSRIRELLAREIERQIREEDEFPHEPGD